MFSPRPPARPAPALAALRRRLMRLRVSILLLALAGLAGYWASVAVDLRRNEAETRAAVDAQAQYRVRLLGEFIGGALAQFDFILDAARTARRDPGGRSLVEQGRAIAGMLPKDLLYQLIYIGPDGYLAYSSLGPVPREYLGDREYFRELQHADADRLVLGAPVQGRVTSHWSIHLARPVYDVSGKFDGVVALAVSPEKWSERLARFELGPGDVLAVLTGRGDYLLRTLEAEAYFGRRVQADRPFLTHPGQSQGSYVETGSFDGVERLYVWQRLPSGLIVVSGTSLHEALRPAHAINAQNIGRSLWGSTAFVLCVAALLLLLQRHGREAERAGEREAQVSAMFATMAEGLAIVQPDGNISFCNDAFAHLLQLTHEQVRDRVAHMGDWKLSDADGHPLGLADLPSVRSARTGCSFDDVILHATVGSEKRCFSASTRPLYHPGATHPYGSVVTLRDITAERAATAAARISQWVFEAASEGIIVTDAESVILAVNPAFTSITGYTAAEAVGRKPSLLSAGQHEPEFYQQVYRALDETGTWEGEFQNRRKNGDNYVSHIRISCQRDSRGHVQHYVGLFADVTVRKQRESAIWHQANFDALTGLPNRVLLLDRLAHLLHQARRHDSQVAVLFIDLDRFKPVNDRLGHAAGDDLLCQVSRRVHNLFREEDTLARLGGDEFVLVLPDQNGQAAAERAAERIVDTVSQPFRLGDEFVEISCSIGVALFPRDGDTPETLLQQADAAMYRAKSAGRATWSH